MELQDLPLDPLAAVPVLDSQVDSPGKWWVREPRNGESQEMRSVTSVYLSRLRLGKNGFYVINGQPDWANGTTGGTGFGPWTFYASSHGGADAFTGLEVDNNGTGDANIVAADDSVFKLYAVEFDTGSNPWEEAIAYRTFNTSLSTAGDGFGISLETQNGNNGIGTPGQVGFALRNGNTTDREIRLLVLGCRFTWPPSPTTRQVAPTTLWWQMLQVHGRPR